MIDYEGNEYTPEPHKPEQPKPHGDGTLDWLEEHCEFRPYGAEW